MESAYHHIVEALGDRKGLILALTGIGLLLTILGVSSQSWIAAPEAGDLKMQLGLREAQICLGPMCDGGAYTKIFTDSERVFVLLGRLVFFFGIFTAVTLAGSAVAVATSRELPGPVSVHRLGGLACAASLVLAFAFVANAPDMSATTDGFDASMLFGDQKSVPWGFYLFLAGTSAGGAGLLLQLRLPTRDRAGRPVEATEGRARGLAPPCPKCSATTFWAAQYSRYHCRACRRYL